jgi:hypothetical protein
LNVVTVIEPSEDVSPEEGCDDDADDVTQKECASPLRLRDTAGNILPW